MHLQKNEFAFFCNLAKTAPSLEVIAGCTNNLQNLSEDMTRGFKDIIKTSPPGWIIDMAHFDVLSEKDIDPIIAGEILERKDPANNAMQGLCGPCEGCPYGYRTDLAAGAVVAPHGLTARV